MREQIIFFPTAVEDGALLPVTNAMYAPELHAMYLQFVALRDRLYPGEGSIGFRANGVLVSLGASIFTARNITDASGIAMLQQTKELMIEREATDKLLVTAGKMFEPKVISRILGINHPQHFHNPPFHLESRDPEKFSIRQFLFANRREMEMLQKTKTRQLLKRVDNGFNFFEPEYGQVNEDNGTYTSLFK